MKKFLVVFLTALCVVCAAIALVGCERHYKHSFDREVVADIYLASPATYTAKAEYYYSCECGAKGNRTFYYGDVLIKDGITFNNFIVDEENCGYIKVANSVTTYSFIKEINVNGNATYSLSLDVYGLITVPTKTVSLEIGDNTFYVLQTVEDEITLYTITIRRRPIYTVTFDSDGETEIESQSIEEDSFAVEPKTPIKVTCVFCGWGYDFSKAVVSDINLVASWAFDERMNQFNYTSTDSTCEILGVKDKTIESVKIPEYITSIGDRAFELCGKLSKIYIDSLESWCGIHGIKNLMKFGKSKELFLEEKELTDIVIPDGVTYIDDYAFYNCDGLTSLKFSDSVTSIGELSFFSCERLNNVIIPDSVIRIGNESFLSCLNLERIVLGSGVSFIGSNSFDCCDKLEKITVVQNNPIIYSAGNCIIERATGKLILGCRSSVIIDGVKEIGDYAFSPATFLLSIEIPEGVTRIGNYAFCGCCFLGKISIPSSVVSIGDEAFGRCLNLKGVVFKGNISEWEKIYKGSNWKQNVPAGCIVHCVDGDINI